MCVYVSVYIHSEFFPNHSLPRSIRQGLPAEPQTASLTSQLILEIPASSFPVLWLQACTIVTYIVYFIFNLTEQMCTLSGAWGDALVSVDPLLLPVRAQNISICGGLN